MRMQVKKQGNQCSVLVYGNVCLALVPAEAVLAWFLRWPCRKWSECKDGFSFMTIKATGD